MGNKELQSESRKMELRGKIVSLEKKILNIPGTAYGDQFPLKHSFAKDLYVREIFVPAGQLIVTKIHKFDHPYFLMRGVCRVLTEEGPKKIEAPFWGMTPAGTKRVVYTETDTWWITVHGTKETDLEKIEGEIIAKDFDEALPDVIEVKAIEEVER